MDMTKIYLNRQELFDFLWDEPISKFASKYNLTIKGLRKKCEEHQIELPSSDYWRIPVTNKTSRPKLNPIATKEEIFLCYQDQYGKYYEKEPSYLEIIQQNIKHSDSINTIVPNKLTNPLSVVRLSKKALDSKSILNHGMYYTHQNKLVIASRGQYSRALRIIDTLIKALIASGYEIINEQVSTYVKIHGIKIEIRIREKTKTVEKESEYEWDRKDYVPSGILGIVMEEGYQRNYWDETNTNPLENKIAWLVAKLADYAYRQKIKNQEIQKYWEEQREIQKKEDEKRALAQKELDDLELLHQYAKRWKQCELIKLYLKNPNVILPEGRDKKWANDQVKKLESLPIE